MWFFTDKKERKEEAEKQRITKKNMENELIREQLLKKTEGLQKEEEIIGELEDVQELIITVTTSF